ncbi:hypothetical protein GGD54_005336 [Rhizobium tropici]|uniref:Uncharacterized protein n=4 Tax=Rhizobium TaxID=379 RepID=A0A7W9D3B2_9HYPH|nr:hypothetical protein [Rhizobium tropici]MBB4569941.1 hypothetical protein [Rhizobium leucaenae]MBB5576153.1 hypothetical protein [Rhizobium paranaense]MBB6489445.1 hypothetical protein [Rhizobium lusitanum]MBB5596027.1 hypothetical protein [Rhizobium tropici]
MAIEVQKIEGVENRLPRTPFTAATAQRLLKGTEV